MTAQSLGKDQGKFSDSSCIPWPQHNVLYLLPTVTCLHAHLESVWQNLENPHITSKANIMCNEGFLSKERYYFTSEDLIRLLLWFTWLDLWELMWKTTRNSTEMRNTNAGGDAGKHFYKIAIFVLRFRITALFKMSQ